MTDAPNWDLTAFREANDVLPTEMLSAGPPKYGPMVETATGTWRTISTGGIPVAIAWTDGDEGFNIVILRDSPLTQALRAYPTNAKACGIPANWAYETLDNWAKRQDIPVALGEPESGKLSGVWVLSDRLGTRSGTMSSTSVNDTENEDVPEV